MPSDSDADAVALTKESNTSSTRTRVLFQLFTAVVAHCLILQSEASLFLAACGGNRAKTARVTSLTAAIVGVVSLFVNQICGKASDCVGRKGLFYIGPVMNMLVGAAIYMKPKDLMVLSVGRVIKQVCTTLSGTLACTTAALDILKPVELGEFFGKIPQWVGVAVLLSPMMEGWILKYSKGDYRFPFLALIPLSLLSLASGTMLPETLKSEKRADWSKFTQSLSSLNPFSFIKIFQTKNKELKQLSFVETVQYTMEGRNTSDFFQLWMRSHCQAGNDVIAKMISYWGTCVTMGGIFVTPQLMNMFSPRTYTLVANGFVGTAMASHALAEKASILWVGIPFLVPGVNGANCHQVKALASAKATKEEGFDNGEYSAMQTNMRAINNAIAPVVIGRWYSYCIERGIYAGTTWVLVSCIGAYFPSLVILTCMSDKAFEMPKADAA